MQYEIVSMKEKTVAGFAARTNNSSADMRKTIGGLWKRFYSSEGAALNAHKTNNKTLGIYTDYSSDENGDYTAMDVSELGLEFGSFYALYDYDLNEIDSSYYVLTMNGNDTLTITVKEELLMSLTDGYYFIVADFEKVTLAPAFIVEIPEKAEASAVEQTTVKKTGSPKTGVKGVGLAAAMLSLSGAVAFITRKRK